MCSCSSLGHGPMMRVVDIYLSLCTMCSMRSSPRAGAIRCCSCLHVSISASQYCCHITLGSFQQVRSARCSKAQTTGWRQRETHQLLSLWRGPWLLSQLALHHLRGLASDTDVCHALHVHLQHTNTEVTNKRRRTSCVAACSAASSSPVERPIARDCSALRSYLCTCTPLAG